MEKWQVRNLRGRRFWSTVWVFDRLNYDIYTYGIDSDEILNIADAAGVPLEVVVDYLIAVTREVA